MKAEDVITLIQHYRHDLLNQLQIVSGYIQLGDVGKAEAQMGEVLHDFNEERKLLSLNIPQVNLWILQFSSHYQNYQLSYDVDVGNKSLLHQDTEILVYLEKIMEILEESRNNSLVLELDLEFRDAIDYCIIEIYVDKSNLNNIEETIRKEKLETIDFQITEEIVTFQFQVLYL